MARQVSNISDTSQKVVSAVGFWLPCGRTNFCDIEKNTLPSKPEKLSPLHSESTPRLEDSVCKRLSDVLGVRGYSQVTGLVARTAEPSSKLTYPDAIVFVAQGSPPANLDSQYTDLGPSTSPNWPSGIQVDFVILLANMQGFYYLVSQHGTNIDQSKVIMALKTHAASLLGKDFYSHVSGRDLNAAASPRISDTFGTLKAYVERRLGVLNLFQMTAIIEGIYNSYFDPRIFFRERSDSQQHFDTASREYSLGRFAQMICAELDVEHVAPALSSIAIEPIATRIATYEQVNAFRNAIDCHLARAIILRQFLDWTSAYCLRHPLKMMIERCRSALLGKMLEVTHRREPITQVEAPHESPDQVLLENEEQLRGYVMLVSAKIPIIKNIYNQVEELASVIEEQSPGTQAANLPGPKYVPGSSVQSARAAWKRLFDSLADNVGDVEKAIEQSRMERLLHEQSQMRAEQETASELARVRTRFGLTGGAASGGWEWSTTFQGSLSLVVALGSMVVACASASAAVKEWAPWIAGGTVTALLVFIGLPIIIKHIQMRKQAIEYLNQPNNNEHHYEFDYHLNVPISEEDAIDLCCGDFKQAARRRAGDPGIESARMASQMTAAQMEFADGKSYMHTYRVDRFSEEEAIYKIHVEAKVHDLLEEKPKWVRWFIARLLGLHSDLILSIVYEVLVQLASSTHYYILRDVRVIALKNERLQSDVLTRLKQFIIHGCVNVFISDPVYTIRTDAASSRSDPGQILDRPSRSASGLVT